MPRQAAHVTATNTKRLTPAIREAIAQSGRDRDAEDQAFLRSRISFRTTSWAKDLKQRLETIQLRGRKSAAEVARAHNLEVDVICDFAFAHAAARSEREKLDGIGRHGAEDLANDLVRGARALRELTDVDFRAPHPLAEVAAEKAEFGAAIKATLSPFQMPRDFLRGLRGGRTSETFDWSRRDTPRSRDLVLLAQIVEDLAGQLRAAGATLRKNPKFGEDEFRIQFAGYARSQSGNPLDDLGALVFELTFRNRSEDVTLRAFGKVDALDYARCRRRAEKRADRKIKN